MWCLVGDGETQPNGLPPRYTIVREIGRGAMAIVYEGVDAERADRVAIKVLRPELAQSVSARRFNREIAFLRLLHHPNILPILDASDDHAEWLFLVAPYLAEDTLRQLVTRSGPLPLDATMRIVVNLASALDYAHSRNIVHRDLKPENVLFDGTRAVLADFGIARAIVASFDEQRLSSSGIVVGTPQYMSPEQQVGDPLIDGRTDIYALGCVTYEMLAGEPPFGQRSLLGVAAAHARQPPQSIRSVRPDVPPEVESAIMAAMAKRLHERPATAAGFVACLQRAPGLQVTEP